MAQVIRNDRKPLAESFRIIAHEAKQSTATIGKDLKEGAKSSASTVASPIIEAGKRIAVDRHGASRKNVVMVRLDADSLRRLNDLVDAGVTGSRSEAASYLINEGIQAKQIMFDNISRNLANVRLAKEELRVILDDELVD